MSSSHLKLVSLRPILNWKLRGSGEDLRAPSLGRYMGFLPTFMINPLLQNHHVLIIHLIFKPFLCPSLPSSKTQFFNKPFTSADP